MTDHKFMDDEIIHSLKVCSNDGDCSECLINPHKGNYGYCTSLAIKAALDLINRQKAQIDELKVELDAMRGAANSYKMHCEEAQAELEDLREIVFMDRSEAIKNLKAETIKDFAQRLKHTLVINNEENDVYFDYAYTLETIDTLVKEMTEELK